jgi:hypothetical protein
VKDFITTNGTITFTNGQTTAFFVVPIINNTNIEGNTTLTVALANANSFPSGNTSIQTPTGTLVIIDDNFAPGQLQFSTNSYGLRENAGSVTVTVIRTNGSTGVISANFGTANGSALAYPGFGPVNIQAGGTVNYNYFATNGVLTFADSETNKTFTITAIPDNTVTPDLTVNMTLSSPSGGAVLGFPSAATLTITNVDFSAGTFNFTTNFYTVNETNANAVFVVQRSGVFASNVSVVVSTFDVGSAVAGVDYTATTNTLVFTAAQPATNTINFVVPLNNSPSFLAQTNNQRFFGAFLANALAGSGIGSTSVATNLIVPNKANAPGIIGFASPVYSVLENFTNATIAVVRTSGTNSPYTQ